MESKEVLSLDKHLGDSGKGMTHNNSISNVILDVNREASLSVGQCLGKDLDSTHVSVQLILNLIGHNFDSLEGQGIYRKSREGALPIVRIQGSNPKPN
jgi:hypothetical protein